MGKKSNGFNYISEINKKEKEKITNELIIYRRNNTEEQIQIIENINDKIKTIPKKRCIDRVFNIN